MIENETSFWSGAFGDLSFDDQLSAARLVEEGRAVIGTTNEIAARLKRTRIIALLRVKEIDRIIGLAALKTPNQQYRAGRFASAGVSIVGYENAPELGYVAIAEDMRGRSLSGRLADAITREIREPAFATTDSNTMRPITRPWRCRTAANHCVHGCRAYSPHLSRRICPPFSASARTSGRMGRAGRHGSPSPPACRQVCAIPSWA